MPRKADERSERGLKDIAEPRGSCGAGLQTLQVEPVLAPVYDCVTEPNNAASLSAPKWRKCDARPYRLATVNVFEGPDDLGTTLVLQLVCGVMHGCEHIKR